MLRYQRSARNKQIGFGVAALAAAVIVAGEEGRAYGRGDYARGAQIGVLSQILVGLGLQLAFIAAINGYGRDLEREADEGGLSKMSTAGYDPREAPKVYQALLDDHGDPSKAEAFFFGAHPRLAERIADAREWNRTHPETPPRKTTAEADAEFARRMRPVVRDDARLNIDMGRLKLAEDELTRVLAAMPEDPRAQWLWGRLRLKQADGAHEPETRAKYEQEAKAAIEEALRLSPDLADAHRELGLFAHRHNNPAAACSHFKRYLELAPKADDAPRIHDYILEYQRAGQCK
jgi:predicted Zn-dependent protease